MQWVSSHDVYTGDAEHMENGLNGEGGENGGKEDLSWKIWTPPKMDPLVQIFRNIWTPMELIFQELDEIFRLPLKFLDPPLQRVNNLF